MPARDARGRLVAPEAPVRRVVSLVPSTTETVCDLGAAERLVGVTRFCVHPRAVTAARTVVGGTKDADPAAVLALRPDLVLANCEENTRELFEALDPHVPVWAAFPKTVDQALADLLAVGDLLGVGSVAADWVRRIALVREAARAHARPFRYAYLIWRKPYMAVSDDTFIASLLGEVGGTNALATADDRFPVVTPDDLRAANLDRLLLSSEPFPFAAKHRAELAASTGLPADAIQLVDGERCSWHGTRLASAFPYLAAELVR